jgi:ATP phosphoribosyltransferase regulatory subunit HisZ
MEELLEQWSSAAKKLDRVQEALTRALALPDAKRARPHGSQDQNDPASADLISRSLDLEGDPNLAEKLKNLAQEEETLGHLKR